MSKPDTLLIRLTRAEKPADVVGALSALTLARHDQAIDAVRTLLRSPEDDVRAASAHYLGFVSSGLVLPDLVPVAEADPVEFVRTAARHAAERIMGDRDKSDPTAWERSDEPTPHTNIAPARKAVAEAQPPGPMTVGPKAPARRPTQAPVRSSVGLNPARQPVARKEITPEAPPPLSKADKALISLGKGRGDAEKAVARLNKRPAAEITQALTPSGQGPDHEVGLAMAAVALERTDCVPALRKLLGREDPRVRTAAITALGALASADNLGPMSSILRDSEPAVRVAAVAALVAAAKRTGKASMARTWLTPLRYGPDPDAAAAAKAGLADTRGLRLLHSASEPPPLPSGPRAVVFPRPPKMWLEAVCRTRET